MEYRSLTRRAAVRCGALTLFLLAAACASIGRDFARPDPDSLVLGQTTISEVVGKFGPPQRRSKRTSISPSTASSIGSEELPAGLRRASVPGDIESLGYAYARATGSAFGTTANSRFLSLGFWNDKLISWSYVSNFAGDDTNFDDAKLSSFVKGKMTRADILRELGKPGGEGIYPFVMNKGTRTLSYQYVSSTKRSGFISKTSETNTKLVRFLFDSSDKLIETYTQTRTSTTQVN